MKWIVPAPPRLVDPWFRSAVLALVVCLAATMLPHLSAAAPVGNTSDVSLVAQNVDYIDAATGAALDLGFPVLVPSWVPAPFGGAPSVSAGGGSYSLYWMNAGGEPTFLQVSGVVGGGLPAGSPYDLNIELTINASVNGYGAIHDVTPIYDAVWWIQGGVLYSVQSRNMTGTDSLSLANSLIQFVPPAAPEPTAAPPPPTDPPVEVPQQPGQPSGEQGVSPPDGSEPDATSDESATDEQTSDPAESTDGQGGQTDATTAADTSQGDANGTGSDGTGNPSVASDGTGGPPVQVIPSDGTGGDDVIILPWRSPVELPSP